MIRTFFGNPGCGKTTLCCKYLLKNQKRYKHTIANFRHSVPGAYYYETLRDFGKWCPPHYSWCGWDESGIDFNSRAYKSMSQECISLHKKHRHARLDIDCFSQAWDDIDITLRRLSVEMWHMIKIGPWTLCRRIYKRFGIDQNTKQPIDQYRQASMLWLLFWPLQLGWPFDKKFTLTFRPFYYKYFDSWELNDIPIKLPVQVPEKRRRVGADRVSAPHDERKKNSYFVALKGFINKSVARIGAAALSIYLSIARMFSHEEDS